MVNCIYIIYHYYSCDYYSECHCCYLKSINQYNYLHCSVPFILSPYYRRAQLIPILTHLSTLCST